MDAESGTGAVAEPGPVGLSASGRPTASTAETVHPYTLTLLEFSLATASLAELEEVARSVGPEWVATTYRAQPWIEEIALLSTCHRVELVVGTREPMRLIPWAAGRPGRPTGWRRRTGPEAVLHLFRVAAGLESLAVGEREVRDQVRAAAHAVVSRHPRPVLKELLLAAAEAAHAEAAAAPTPPSVVSIAQVAAARLMGSLHGPSPRVVVVGSGRVGRQLAGLLAPHARVTVVYRSAPPAGAGPDLDVAFAPFGRLPELIASADGVVTAAKAAGRLLGPAMLAGRTGGLTLIDLGVPRNIDPVVGSLPGLHLIDLQELYRDAPATTASATEALARPIAERARAAADRLERVRPEAWTDALGRAAESVRADEVGRARPQLAGLTAEQQRSVDRLTRRIVARLLRTPLEALRELPAGAEADGERDRRLRQVLPVDDGRP